MSQLYSLPVPDRSQGGLSPARARLAEATIALRDAVEEMETVARPSNRPFFGRARAESPNAAGGTSGLTDPLLKSRNYSRKLSG
jgi:hypothetical protein